MAKNYMPNVAKMLGVELEEEFMIPDKDVILKITAKDGLMYRFDGNENWECGASDLQDLLIGEYEIVKLPWKPKICQIWYYPNITFKKVFWELWEENTRSYALYLLGMCYRTREEAEAHFADDYKKLTGKELEQ